MDHGENEWGWEIDKVGIREVQEWGEKSVAALN